MNKKNSEKKKKKKKESKKGRKEKLVEQLNPSVTIMIQSAKIVRSISKLVSYPSGPIEWIVINRDSSRYKVEIDVARVIHHTPKGDVKEHPFSGQISPIPVDASGGANNPADHQERLKRFKPTQDPDPYKYTIELIDSLGAIIDTYDPDLDVVDPNSIPHL
jgi:hypothetical protein